MLADRNRGRRIRKLASSLPSAYCSPWFCSWGLVDDGHQGFSPDHSTRSPGHITWRLSLKHQPILKGNQWDKNPVFSCLSSYRILIRYIFAFSSSNMAKNRFLLKWILIAVTLLASITLTVSAGVVIGMSESFLLPILICLVSAK